MRNSTIILPQDFTGQHQLCNGLNRFVFGDESVQLFRASEYDGCRISMQDSADAHCQELSDHRFVRYKLAYIEQISDNPQDEIMILRSLDELGEEFNDSFERQHLLFNFITEQPDPQLTVDKVRFLLQGSLVSPEALKWIEQINHPDALEVKRLLVLCKLAGRMENGWLRIVDNPLKPAITEYQS